MAAAKQEGWGGEWLMRPDLNLLLTAKQIS